MGKIVISQIWKFKIEPLHDSIGIYWIKDEREFFHFQIGEKIKINEEINFDLFKLIFT